MIPITPDISLADDEIEERFILSSGPGGQNVNKVESAVQLKFDARCSKSIPTAIYSRLKALAGRRMTSEGVIVITARRQRSQAANRKDALARLVDLIRDAAEPPKPRRKSRPPLASKRKRIETKKRRGTLKKLRGAAGRDDN